MPRNQSRSATGLAGVRTLNPLEIDGWDSRLATLRDANFFHGSPWARVLHDTYGFQPCYFAMERAAELDGLLSVMEVNSWLTGRRGVSLPFADACAPLAGNPAALQTMVEAARAHGRAREWKYLECRGGRALFGDVPASTSFFGHQLDLGHDEATLFQRIESSCRRAIRKASQSGLQVTLSRDLDALKAFYGLLGQTRRRHGLPAQPFRFFQNIHRHVLARGHGCVVLASRDGRPAAGAVFFHFGRTATYKFGASDSSLQHLRANNLVMWEAIKWHARHDFTLLDFGRTSLGNEGLRRYKLGWGTSERPIDYVKFDLRADRFVSGRDEATGWYNRIFRILPPFASRLIGAMLYKHVA